MKDNKAVAHIGILLFRFSLQPQDISLFRGAINEKIDGVAHPLFHNHEGAGFSYRNSLIQYKIINGQAAIVGLGNNALGELEWFANDYDSQLTIGGRIVDDAAIEGLIARALPLEIVPDLAFCYSTTNWVPFSDEGKRKEFGFLRNDIQRIEFLEKILVNHIVTLYLSLGGEEVLQQEKIKVRILSGYEGPAGVFFIHDCPQQTFSIRFYTNARLCSDIGIGNAVTYAAGTLREERE